MTHPSSLDLEAFACGEQRPSLLEHLEECAACGAFVEELRALVGGGPSVKEADDAVARAVAKQEQVEEIAQVAAKAAIDPITPPAPRAHAKAANDVEVAPRDAKRRLWMVATSVITPLAAAAAILILARSTSLPDVPAQQPTPSFTTAPGVPDKIQIGTLPQQADPDTRFKGGLQIAVVRERAGQQTRFSGPVHVRPGDRLRVEVALDREQAILGAVLADDGSYLELMPEGVRGAGTYFSEKSAKIDGSPTRGTIVIGSPEAVARARETKQFDGVTTLRVELEP